MKLLKEKYRMTVVSSIDAVEMGLVRKGTSPLHPRVKWDNTEITLQNSVKPYTVRYAYLPSLHFIEHNFKFFTCTL